MTTTTLGPSSAATGRTADVVPGPAVPGGRDAPALRWAVGVLGALMIVWASVQGAQLVALSDDVEEHAYAPAPVVDLRADGDVVVVVGEDDEVAVLARSRTAFTGTSYSAREVDGRLVVDHRCSSWWATSCDASLEVRVPAGTALVVRSSDGTVGVAG